MDQTILVDLASRQNKTEIRIQAMANNSDMFFLLVNGMFVYFMQCGFAFLECGAVRAKNATNILIKNILDSLIGAVAYWCFGYAFAFGKGNPFIGFSSFANHEAEGIWPAFWFFQFVFAATASTIVSGALAERCAFPAYLIYSVVTTGFIYPVVTHWAWSDEGWLKTGIQFDNNNVTETVTFQDFAGSGVVHLLGGFVALVGAAILGRRIRHIDEKGNDEEIKGHSVPLAALGGFILFMGFFAFNGGSQLHISEEGDGEAVALAIVNTILSGGFGAITSLIVQRIICKIKGEEVKWSLLTTINGGLAGMVAICASGNSVHHYGAAVIGTVAGLNFLMWRNIIIKAGVDDPLDAAAVHSGSGLWGVLAAPILSLDTGIVYTWNKRSFMTLAWNLVGALAIAGWAISVAMVLFGVLHLLKLFRVDPEIERRGLDIPKHGEPAYPRGSYGDGWSGPESSELDINMVDKDLHPDNMHHRKSLPYVIAINRDSKHFTTKV